MQPVEAPRPEEELRTMALLMAHDLRGVLCVLNSLSILIEHNPDQRHLEKMRQQLELCEQLVEHFVLFAEGKAGRGPAQLEAVVAEAVKSVVLPPEIRIETSVAFRGRVAAQPQHLMQVLLNLLNNAIHACRGRVATIEVMAYEEAGCARVDVQDNGPGIPAGLESRLLNHALPDKGKGMGWGLLLCQRVIELTGGRISFTSAPGAGTRFSVWIPIAHE